MEYTDKLININLQIEHNKEDINPIKGFKLYLFETLYLIQKFQGKYKFLDILFTIFEFIQLMSFPINKIFSQDSSNYFDKDIADFFSFSQLIFFWQETSFFIVICVISIIYILIFLSLFFYILINAFSSPSKIIIQFLLLMFQFHAILNIPFLTTLFTIFFCENETLELWIESKYKSGIHIFLIVISTLLMIIYELIILLFYTTLYEFGVQTNKLKSGYSSSTEVHLNLTKLVLIIIYQFVSHKKFLAIITLFISLILLFHFLLMKPYSSGFTMKLYLSLYALFCWSCLMCFIIIIFKNSIFKSGIIMLLFGFPIILISIYLKEWEFSLDEYFSYYLSNSRDGYNNLLEIEYFLKLEDSLVEEIKTREFKLLFAYISDYESKCIEPNCYLKKFMKIPFKIENFENLRILLLKHAELLYKDAISKYPNNIKLRICYAMFLFKKLNKIIKGKNEIILLNKFTTNFEHSFLLYKYQKYFDDTIKDKKEINSNINLSKSITSKEISNEIKFLIENIVTNYISFWNVFLYQDWEKIQIFIKINNICENIKYLNENLNEKIKSLDRWNLIDQNTMKIYIKYLKEIMNDNEKLIKYSNKILEEDDNRHQYEELNLYELNYEEMSKNEDYKYIIINLSTNEINNISLHACKIFGYTKNELIGCPFNILFPKIFNSPRKLFFQNKMEEYKNDILTNIKKIKTETWIDNCFGINKANFLFPLKLKWFITSFCDEQIFGIGNILVENKKIINSKEQEIVYILTDKNLIIHNYTPNAQNILRFNSHFSIINCNIINFIKDLNDKIKLKNKKGLSNIKQSNINSNRNSIHIESNILKQNDYIGQNSWVLIHWKNYELIKGNEISSLSIKNGNSRRSHGNIKFLEKDKININNIDNNQNTFPLTNKPIFLTSVNSNKNNKSNFLKYIDSSGNMNLQNELMLNMRIKEEKFNDIKIGYIFIFKSYIKKERKTKINDYEKDLIILQDINKKITSNKSSMNLREDNQIFNFCREHLEYFNIIPQNIDKLFQNFCTEKENQFTFDIDNMTFKQFKYNRNINITFYEQVKEKAIKKLINIKNQIQNKESEGEEEEEEEEESLESEFTSRENSSNNNSNSSKMIKEKPIFLENQNNIIFKKNKNNSISKENTIEKIQFSKEIIDYNNIEEMNKHKGEDFYHVNLNKIIYFIYNYHSGFMEIQKNQSYKISQVNCIINKEKELLKNTNSKYLVSNKFIKGRKKGIINKIEEENGINTNNTSSIKWKKIHEVLSSKKIEKSIIKMIFASIIIFFFVIGIGFMNIVIYYYLKNSTYSIFLLVEKSDDLYQNLLFEISLVKEMLIVNNPYYNNTLNNNKTLYYQSLSKLVYQYYVEDSFIISNLTNYFNILSKEDEESITQKNVEIYIINPNQSTNFNYQYKKYSVLIYSSYRELNSALLHISKLKIEEIHYYDEDVYYFLKNGMSNLLISSERQMWTLKEKMEQKIKSGQYLIIICCILIFFIYCLFMFIFYYFYKDIIFQKQNYISFLKELDSNLIISSLQKCENLLEKLKGKNKELKKRNISAYSSSADNSNNFWFNEEKNNKDGKIFKNQINKTGNIIKSNKIYLYHFIVFLIIFLWQIFIYLDYLQKLTLYKSISAYEYYISMYASNFIYIFISLREYAFDKSTIFYNKTVEEYVDKTLTNYYVIFSQSSKMKDIYRIHFPQSYQTFLNYLYNSKICEFINNYIREYPNSDTNCDIFFYGSSKFGFFTLLTTFIEEVRLLRDKIDEYYEISAKNNFIYNESLFNQQNGDYEKYYLQYQDNIDVYKRYNPVNILSTNSHKKLLITYFYINIQVYSFLINESLNQFEQVFAKDNIINLILNILFIIVVTLVFIFIWIPFLLHVNKNFGKIKNVLNIIPIGLIINIPSVNKLLGIY